MYMNRGIANKKRESSAARESEVGETEATETRLGTCQRGLGSYKSMRAVRPVNAPLMIAEIWLELKSL